VTDTGVVVVTGAVVVMSFDTPGTTGADGSIRAESSCGVTTGFGGSSRGLTVRVATVG
jgi:glycine cleavage system pyridoxal-binding protein P